MAASYRLRQIEAWKIVPSLDSRRLKGTDGEQAPFAELSVPKRHAAVFEDIRAIIAQIEGVAARHDVIPFGIEDVAQGSSSPGRRIRPRLADRRRRYGGLSLDAMNDADRIRNAHEMTATLVPSAQPPTAPV